MKEILNRLFNHHSLSRLEAKNVLGNISDGMYNPSQVSAFMTVFKMRHITVEELVGFRDCLRERCIPIDLSEFDPIDMCGTGGDGKNTFNISTLASFVVAGVGVNVAKHGNYGVSSRCGSSNVMEYLGYKFTSDHDILKKQLEKSNICFLHAPLFHPAMKEVAPIRRNLGVSTFFNMLGPMVNPSMPQKQLVGVFSLELQRYYKYIYEQEECSYRIVHSLDGYDEISLTSMTKLISPIEERLMDPKEFTTLKLSQESLYGGNTIETSSKIFIDILEGRGTKEQQAVVCANAALAIHCSKNNLSIKDAYELAEDSLRSGKAITALKSILQ